jgi:hypothetical protein
LTIISILEEYKFDEYNLEEYRRQIILEVQR